MLIGTDALSTNANGSIDVHSENLPFLSVYTARTHMRGDKVDGLSKQNGINIIAVLRTVQ